MPTAIYERATLKSPKLDGSVPHGGANWGGLGQTLIWVSLIKLGLLTGGLLAAGIQQVVAS